jgi:hypothetical protein
MGATGLISLLVSSLGTGAAGLISTATFSGGGTTFSLA